MAGYDVSRALIDQKAAEAVAAMRETLERVRTLRAFLVDHPGYDDTSLLVTQYGYTPDEAYLLHATFQELDTARATQGPGKVVG